MITASGAKGARCPIGLMSSMAITKAYINFGGVNSAKNT